MSKNKKYNLDNHLPFRIAVISNILQLGRDIDIRNITDLGSRELRVLLNVGTYMPVSAAQIAFQTKLDSYTVSRGVKVLFEKGLLQKDSLPNNKKEKILSLTTLGLKLYQQIVEKLEARDQQLSSEFSNTQQQSLIENLKQLERQAVKLVAEHAISEQEAGKELAADQKEIIRWFNKMQQEPNP